VLPGSNPFDELAIPAGTTAEEHDVVTDGRVLVGGQSTVEFGIRGDGLFAGERVRVDGDIEVENDCRLDVWCDVEGNVLVGENAYLGERVHVGGELRVAGDLDIGDDVEIDDGFEANGWIVIRNPMPTIVFLFVYLSQLLQIGEEEAAEDLIEQLTGEDESEPLVIPRGATVSDDAWRVSTPATIGPECRLNGNVRASSIEVGEETEIYGSLRAREDITVGEGATVHGDVTTRDGTVRIAPGARVLGDLACEDVTIDDGEIDGAIRARGEVTMGSDPIGSDASGA
jgi:predicted acyltransferase (DUF342 family)